MSETTKRKAAGRDADSLDSKKRKVEPQKEEEPEEQSDESEEDESSGSESESASESGESEEDEDDGLTDLHRKCSRCNDTFLFTADEQRWYIEKGFTTLPGQCKDCKKASRDRFTSWRGGRGFPGSGRGGRGGVRRGGNRGK